MTCRLSRHAGFRRLGVAEAKRWPKPAPRRQAGVTLIELLVAVTLVGLLATGMLFAIRVGLSAMEKTNSRFIANRRVLGVQRILEQQLAGFLPVSADCASAPGTPVAHLPFFEGEPNAMRFVSTYSIQEAGRGYPRILEYRVIPGERNLGVRLVVNEHLYFGPQTTGMFCLGMMPDPELGMNVPRFVPIQVGPQSFVLADKLSFCRIIYQERLAPPALDRWVARWIKPQWPSAVRVEMAQLDRDPAKLQLMTITAPLKSRRDPLYHYAN